jgi:ankyrin repeat protein
MKYIRLFENFESYDPYELMIIPPNVKAEMIMREIKKSNPNLNLVNDLIVLGANVDWQDEDNRGWTPLHVAAYYGKVEIAKMLIDAGADVDVQDEWGKTSLHVVAIYGNVEIARMLIDAGADVDVQDEDGWTALHWSTGRGDIEIAKVLLDAGARKDIPNNSDKLPYDLARTEELKKLLKP